MFGEAEIKVRPVKLAFLVEPNNATHVREAIKLCSSLWGGTYFPIIPIYGRMPATWRDKLFKTPKAQSVVLGLIDAFDPDILVQFTISLPSYIEETGRRIIKPEAIWKQFGVDNSPAFGIGIFDLLADIYREHFKYKAKYPIKLVLPIIPRRLALFWSSVFGELPEMLLPALRNGYFEPLEIEHSHVDPTKLKDMLKGNVMFPRRVSAHEIKVHGRSSFGSSGAGFFMDASKIEDVIDYWNLRATGRDVLPMPKQLLDDPGFLELASLFFREHRVHWKHQPQHCDRASIIRSRNSTMDEMQDFAKILKIERPANDPSSDGFYLLQHWYPRIWDEWARAHDGEACDIYGNEAKTFDLSDIKDGRLRFQSILPKFANKHVFTGEVRCINEFDFRFYGTKELLAEVFPDSSGDRTQRAIASIGSMHEWRIGRNGLLKFVQHEYSESRDLPASEPIFFAWMEDRGWTAKLSSPGILAKQIYQKLDGNIDLLFNEQLLGLIEHMNGGAVNADGTAGAPDKVGQDRHKPVGEVKNRLKESWQKDLHDYLVARGIFKMGLQVQCPECQRKSWFSVDSLRETIKCPKCLCSFPAIGNVDSGLWCYKTTGPFSVPNYADGSYSVLLALNFFNQHRFIGLRTTPVFSFTATGKDNQKIEADFGLLWSETSHGRQQRGLVFGECKTYGYFQKKDFERMRQLGTAFPGAILVFSTLRTSLTKEEIVGIARLAKMGRKRWKADYPVNPVLVLTGTEILTHDKPPRCWKKDEQKQYERINGLLDMCNATQQIYLNLPSWHQEWHDNSEKRHKRMIDRQSTGLNGV